ncbi:hypothetical protein KIH86_17935 [Paenibacillus sp. HN-1]|uniref:hypothetical protein n=1 Tax=Paenibacillus TaxID=44249 RepID=UPI001CAA26C1|nr:MULTISPECIES: hypothetical protein [Paenibacillus]MBY9078250.1 hypothetical protein [Paenibacillus sp. CGMCC 1.18879]MBY9086091.1 hypothetical protein [Paenibacillus sinensis]
MKWLKWLYALPPLMSTIVICGLFGSAIWTVAIGAIAGLTLSFALAAYLQSLQREPGTGYGDRVPQSNFGSW